MKVIQEYTIKLTGKEVRLLDSILCEYKDYKAGKLDTDFDSELYNFSIKLYNEI